MKLYYFVIQFFLGLIFFSCSSNYQKDDMVLKEWLVGYSEGHIDNNVWGGNLYCYEDKIEWYPNKANEVVSQFFTGGKPWVIYSEDIVYIGIEETLIGIEGVGVPASSIEIITNEGKKYYLRTTLSLENKDLMNYLIDTYQ